MKATNKQILFISHKANRSGAAILLLEIIREFRKQSVMPVQVVVMEDGPLVEDFRQLAPTWQWPVGKKSKRRFILFRWFSRIRVVATGLQIMFRIRKSTHVFSNTITNGHIQRKFAYLQANWMTYVHELPISIQSQTNRQTLATVIKNTRFFLAGSRAVQENLIHFHKIDPAQTAVVYSSIPQTDRQRSSFSKETGSLRHKLQIPEGCLIIGVAGESEWRKGFDWFAPMVRIFLNAFPESEAHFVWLGVRKERAEYFRDNNDFEKFGFGDRVHLIEHGSEYLSCMAFFDIHLLLAREDPFPLVVLDAASFSIPTVCFEQGGGTPEFVESDAGICVPYGDLFACARVLRELEVDAIRRSELGNRARVKLKSGFDQREATKKIIELINKKL